MLYSTLQAKPEPGLLVERHKPGACYEYEIGPTFGLTEVTPLELTEDPKGAGYPSESYRTAAAKSGVRVQIWAGFDLTLRT